MINFFNIKKVFSSYKQTSVNTARDGSKEVMAESKEDTLSDLKQEVDSLREQINCMEEQSELKQKAIADLAREKEKLSMDLRKQKRSNVNLKQQLEEERSFYIQEKEQYCQEMNEIKKFRRQEINRKLKSNEKFVDNKITEEENDKLKSALKETLQANYNLSVKFLRMKNSKFCIKNCFKKLQAEHEKVITELKAQVEKSQNDIENLISRQMQLHVSPSHKKYLQIMKTNSQLLHENLSLQAQIDQLNHDLNVIKTAQVKQETCNKLKYIHTSKSASGCSKIFKSKCDKESQTDIRLTDEILISEYLSTKLTNISTSKSTLCSATCETETENYILFPDMVGNCEVVRTQSAPGIVQNLKHSPRFVSTIDISTNT